MKKRVPQMNMVELRAELAAAQHFATVHGDRHAASSLKDTGCFICVDVAEYIQTLQSTISGRQPLPINQRVEKQSGAGEERTASRP